MKINKKKEKDFKIKGGLTLKDVISPAYISLKNPKYIEIDNEYYGGIIIANYSREYQELILKKLIDSNINMNISIFYEKQDSYKSIRDLTYHIGNVGVDIKSNDKNRQDIEIAAFTYNDAKYIRKEIQLNNEELYFLYIYIDIYAGEKRELEHIINKIEGILQSMGMLTIRANFRQEQLFISCLPMGQNPADIKVASRRNVLTSGLTSTYPFISSSIFDEDGIFIGTNMYNDSLVFIDRYNSNKYKNANMCVFGTSGSRKIFLYKIVDIKIYVIRNRAIYYRPGKRI